MSIPPQLASSEVLLGGGGCPNIYARDINASFCEFTILNIGLSGAGFCNALIKYCAE